MPVWMIGGIGSSLRIRALRALALCFVCAVAYQGCEPPAETTPGEEIATEAPSRQQAVATDESLPSVSNQAAPVSGVSASLSSTEAATLAYGEAVNWRQDAVFWYMVAHTLHETHLDPDWTATGKSRYWLINFANPENDEELTVQIEGNRIKKTSTSNRRRSPCRPEYPKDRPGVSLEDAAKPLVAHGVTAQVLPQVCYTIDNMDPAYHGRPVWLFSCEERREDASDLYYAFIVDGLTGALLEIHDAAGNKLTAEGLETLRHPPAEPGSGPAHQETVEAFFALVSKGKLEEALAMMDSEMAPNPEMRQMWSDNLATIKTLSVTSIEPFARDKWKAGLQTYHVTLDVALKPDAAFVGWDEGVNERWVQIQPDGPEWRIHAIGTGP